MISSSRTTILVLTCLLTCTASAQQEVMCDTNAKVTECVEKGIKNTYQHILENYGPNVLAAIITGIVSGTIEYANVRYRPESINYKYGFAVTYALNAALVKISCNQLEQRGIQANFFNQWLVSNVFNFITQGTLYDLFSSQ